ncbi:small GTP-binding protein domain [Vavraia culicis subsp. floridensis]|uniref:Small GTP-binding protein domain n=1 Tax=Vavraia culicis (isolate floridensis) TaxID=948595 RepID=L2GWK3_VAVCU|nr:small GTP-binding protein domain [Vavraia culicis subsp. floridensis]ELA47678.1 small GTP-binding protein domain [Vavraia culicis subsp. floridensis]
MAQQFNQYKLILIGDGGTGKTTYLQRVKEGSFRREYIATIGVDVRDVTFKTNYDTEISFQVWDTAGQEMYAQLNDVYYIGASAAIIMFDVTSRITFRNVETWLRKLRLLTTQNNNNIPVIVCGNKIDLKDRKVNQKYIREHLSRDITCYVDISAKSNHHFEVPFLVAARKLTGIEDLQFVENINLQPPDVVLDPETIYESQRVMDAVHKAQNMQLPDDNS